MSKLIRGIDQLLDLIRNNLVLFKLRLKYPSLEISGKTFIEKGCKIISEDGAQLILIDVYISSGTFIRAAKGAIIKIESSFIGRNCVLVSTSKIEVKKNCEIAELVVIRDQDHNHDLTSNAISSQGIVSSPIFIGENVWIGCKATLLKGIEVGNNSVIGAHSLVNKSIPPSSIAVGIPAKRINNNG